MKSVKEGKKMLRVRMLAVLGLVLFLVPAQAGDLESVLYRELGAGMKSGLDQLYKFIKATDIIIDQPIIKIRKGYLFAQVKGSYMYNGQRLHASYATIWKDSQRCVFVAWLEFKAEGDQNIVFLINKALKAMYENKCESKSYISNAISAAWILL